MDDFHIVATVKVTPQLPIWFPSKVSCGAVGQEATVESGGGDRRVWWRKRCLCLCAETGTPNHGRKTLVPAWHLAADQDDRLIIEDGKKVLHFAVPNVPVRYLHFFKIKKNNFSKHAWLIETPICSTCEREPAAGLGLRLIFLCRNKIIQASRPIKSNRRFNYGVSPEIYWPRFEACKLAFESLGGLPLLITWFIV